MTAPVTEPSFDFPSQDVGSEVKLDRREAIFLVVVLTTHVPFVVRHFINLSSHKPHYQFFPLLLASVAWLLWKRWPGGTVSRQSSTKLATLLVLISLGLLTASVLLFSPWLATVAAIVALAAVFHRLAGRDTWRDWLPVWALLWLLVPPPLGWDEDLIFRLQLTTSRASSLMLDVVGVRHLPHSNVVELPGRRLFVDEACSGVNSLFVLFAATAVFVVAAKRPLVWSALLLATSVFWAAVANTARVTTIAIAQSRYDVDLSSGW
jgi:exosortase